MWLPSRNGTVASRECRESHLGTCTLMMARSLKKKSPPQSRGGVITEFIFAFMIAGAVGIVLFALSYSLMVTEVVQYIAFATSRAHMAGSISPAKQKENAERKYKSLTEGDGAIARTFKNSWFELGKVDQLQIRQGEGASTGEPDFTAQFGGGGIAFQRGRFIGIIVPLTLKILNMRFKFLGSTNPDQSDDTFKTYINAFLIREPSQLECRKFFQEKRNLSNWQNILAGQLPQNLTTENQWSLGEDNGC